MPQTRKGHSNSNSASAITPAWFLVSERSHWTEVTWKPLNQFLTMSFAYPPSQGPPPEGYPPPGNAGDYGPSPVPPSSLSNRFSVYQIDFTAQASGKRIGKSA